MPEVELYQIPGIQEPVLPPELRPEASHPDAWIAKYPDQLLPPPFLLGNGTQFVTDLEHIGDEEFTFVTWRSQYPDQLLPPPFLIGNGESLYDPEHIRDEEFQFVSWQSKYPDQLLPAPRVAHSWFELPTEEIPLPHYIGNSSLTIIRDKVVIYQQYFPDPTTPAAAEDIFVDKWLRSFDNPRLPSPFLIGNGLIVDDISHLGDEEFPFVEKWSGKWPDQLLPKPFLVGNGLFVTDPEHLTDEEFTFVTWLPKYPDQLLPKERPAHTWFELPKEEIPLPVYLGSDSLVIVYKRKIIIPSRFIPLIIEEEITLDKWFKQTEEPVREHSVLVPEGFFVNDPEHLTDEEFPFVEKWLAKFPNIIEDILGTVDY